MVSDHYLEMARWSRCCRRGLRSNVDLQPIGIRLATMDADHRSVSRSTTSIPRLALGLGWGGIVPFAGLALLAIAADHETASIAAGALISYGAVILSFMGGVQWGLEMGRQKATRRTRRATCTASCRHWSHLRPRWPRPLRLCICWLVVSADFSSMTCGVCGRA